MSTDYSKLKFSDYLAGGAWFPDESSEDEADTGQSVVSDIRGVRRYVGPPSEYLEFSRWQGDVSN